MLLVDEDEDDSLFVDDEEDSLLDEDEESLFVSDLEVSDDDPDEVVDFFDPRLSFL